MERDRDFAHYVRDFAEKPAPCYDGMNIGDAFYLPMIQLIDYLRDNSFATFICSGSDQLVVRGLVEGGMILSARYVIGTEELISASDQGDKAAVKYDFSRQDELVLAERLANGFRRACHEETVFMIKSGEEE